MLQKPRRTPDDLRELVTLVDCVAGSVVGAWLSGTVGNPGVVLLSDLWVAWRVVFLLPLDYRRLVGLVTSYFAGLGTFFAGASTWGFTGGVLSGGLGAAWGFGLVSIALLGLFLSLATDYISLESLLRRGQLRTCSAALRALPVALLVRGLLASASAVLAAQALAVPA